MTDTIQHAATQNVHPPRAIGSARKFLVERSCTCEQRWYECAAGWHGIEYYEDRSDADAVSAHRTARYGSLASYRVVPA